MEPLKCCVIATDANATGQIKSYLEGTAAFAFEGAFDSLAGATKTVLTGDIDVVFIEVEMPVMNGFEFMRILPSGCKVVFLANTEKWAYEAFKVNAAGYLLTPITYADFMRVATRLYELFAQRRQLDSQRRRYLIVKSDYKMQQIPLTDILFIEGLKDYVKIYLVQDQRSVMTLMSMRMLEAYLPSTMFMRIHRSYIINLTHLRTIERARVVFGSHYLPVSETYKAAFADYVAANSVATIASGEGEV